jgi:hypothetical protein
MKGHISWHSLCGSANAEAARVSEQQAPSLFANSNVFPAVVNRCFEDHRRLCNPLVMQNHPEAVLTNISEPDARGDLISSRARPSHH